MDDRVEVYGDGGLTFANLHMGNALPTYSETGYGYAVEKAPTTKGWSYPVYEELWNYGFPQEMHHFARCARQGDPDRHRRGWRTVQEVLLAGYRSARMGAKMAYPSAPLASSAPSTSGSARPMRNSRDPRPPPDPSLFLLLLPIYTVSIELIWNGGGHPHLIEGYRNDLEETQREWHPIAGSAVAARQGDKVHPAEAAPGLTVPGNRACRAAWSGLERSSHRLKRCDRRLRLFRLGRGDRSSTADYFAPIRERTASMALRKSDMVRKRSAGFFFKQRWTN